ncbi:MAG: RnfH family protein [Burkholderiales bacterium]|jgi:putative ubiquitin-RnfH superfamily antitoxin RatB of RatAB toxin-antitoxin module|nr:RnfH family protein [Burkholderiales bacterium]MCE3269220.1 RnfH family protein [Burkholderiales bacterium]
MNFINIEVAYATPTKQMIIPISVPDTITILEVIALSNIAKFFPENKLDEININSPIGIFGKKINPQTYKLRDKDRIEIYRPLNKTPNQRRLERANK